MIPRVPATLNPTSRRVDVLVDSHLRVDGNVLGADLVDEILDLLTIENEEKIEKSLRNHYGWWDLPDDFLLADLDGDTLVMPRGFALVLKQLLREYNIKIRWRDRMTFGAADIPIEMIHGFEPRDHQPAAVRQIRRHRQGIYVAPTGSGKTVTTIWAISQLNPRKSLILVNSIDLMNQWIGEFSKMTDLDQSEIGQIGDGAWTEGQVTIGIVQSIWARIDELIEDGWFDEWDFVWLDECHHVTADTFNDIMARFTARYRGGTSATPAKTGDFMLATTVLGEIFHEDDFETLERLRILLAPSVRVIPTDFDVPFWGDHEVTRDKRTGRVDECEVPKCPKSGKVPHRHRNNYNAVKAQLIRDNSRNHLVASMVEEYRGHVQLIVSNETTHLKEIENVLGSSLYDIPQDIVYVLTGKEKGDERKKMVAEIKQLEEAVILSTVAGEGLDIPTIEVVHMPFPTKNADKVRQIIGRAMRTAVGKKSCVILDYADKHMGVFRSQLSNRVHKCYMKMKLKIDGYTAREPREGKTGLGRLL